MTTIRNIREDLFLRAFKTARIPVVTNDNTHPFHSLDGECQCNNKLAAFEALNYVSKVAPPRSSLGKGAIQITPDFLL